MLTQQDQTQSLAHSDGDETQQGGWRPWYMVFIISLVSVFAYIDRQVLNLLVEPIKADFGISDTQISLLLGAAFMGAYVAASPIVGRMVDLGNRRNILAAQISIWSFFTVTCGFSRSYAMLFGSRMGVGAAEAGLTPATWSMMTDSFSEKRLPLAFSVFLMAPYIGMGLATILGGVLLQSAATWDVSGMVLVGDMKPWQMVVAIVGLPGFLLALLLFTVREPKRMHRAPVEKTTPPLREVIGHLWSNRGFYGNFYLGMSGVVAVNYALPAWMPSYLIRHFGASAAEVGVDYGTSMIAAGVVGVLLGPWAGRALARIGFNDGLVRVATVAGLGLGVSATGLLLSETYGQALFFAGVAAFFYSLPQAMSASAIQLVTPNRMRGVATSLYIFTINVVGLGIGPTAVAMISDNVFEDPTRVGEALAIVCLGAALLAFLLTWRALKAFRRLRAEME